MSWPIRGLSLGFSGQSGSPWLSGRTTVDCGSLGKRFENDGERQTEAQD